MWGNRTPYNRVEPHNSGRFVRLMAERLSKEAGGLGDELRFFGFAMRFERARSRASGAPA
jgi:hypothetical protein